MPLAAGTKLGPYAILAPLGAGGMGEVYKAQDTRLSRLVAVKVLPEHLRANADALARFAREAMSVAALNHPNIVGIHELATHEENPYAVMELLEGESLRARLDDGPLSVARATELAIQMAEGLAAAHEKGVVHRDLKPENLWITKDGRLKILDFGLAKQLSVPEPGSGSMEPTAAVPADGRTERGMILGTLGYMSPEQVRGEPVDARSDLFSFGAVLFEMLTGKRAFARSSASDTMAAVLRDDPPDVEGASRPVPPALLRIVRHCLEKSPEQRFHSAHDVAFALQSLSTTEAAAPLTAPFERRNRRATLAWAALGAALVAAAGAAGWAFRGGAAPPPTFRLLTHERGTVTGARFVPNTTEVVYSAQWAGAAAQWYARRLDQPGTRPIAGSEGILLAVTQAGEGVGLARTYLSHAVQVGALYSLPLAGGAKREWVSSRVWGAGPGPSAGELAAAVGDFGGEIRLEWPLGHVVAKSLEVVRSPLVRGDRLAYVRERGNIIEEVSLELAERSGAARTLAALTGFTGMAWGPGGRELWVSAYEDGASVFVAVDLSGRTRVLLRHAGRLEIQDVDERGRALVALHSYQRQTFGRARGESKDRDLGWLDAQATTSLTLDGRTALLAPVADWSRVDGNLYVRPLAGGPAQAIGLGQRQSTISQDGRWVATCTLEPEMSLELIPTGPGATRRIPLPDFAGSDLRPDVLPDGKSAILWGRRRGEPFAFWGIDLETGALRKLSPSGTSPYAYQTLLSPDGQRIAYVDTSHPTREGANTIGVSRTDGSEARATVTLDPGEAISGWGPDSASLLVWNRNAVPAEVDRVDLASGRRTRVLTVSPPDPVGVQGIQILLATPDAEAYAYNVTRKLSELYLVEGLK
ncbi:MAG: protein kinase [Vicinamibacteria bacterium]